MALMSNILWQLCMCVCVCVCLCVSVCVSVCLCVCVCVGKKLELLNSDSDIVQKASRFHKKHLLGREINHDFIVHVAS